MPRRWNLGDLQTLRHLQQWRQTPHRLFSTSGNNSESSSEDWEKLLKPFDLEELHSSFSPITPRRLLKLLDLPLDPSTSLDLFHRAGSHATFFQFSDVYISLVDKLGAAADFASITPLLEGAIEEGAVLKEPLFTRLMSWCGKAGQAGNARKVLDEMPHYNCTPTFRSYNVALATLVDAGCARAATSLFFRMINTGIRPTTFTFSIVMKALCSPPSNEVDSACALLREMPRHGCVPDAAVYRTLIHGLCEGRRAREALNLLDEMFLMGCPTPEVETFNEVIHGLAGGNLVYEASKLLDRMLARGCAPNLKTYAILLHGLCAKGELDQARSLLNNVPDANTALFNTVIDGYLRHGRFEEAETLLHDGILGRGLHPNLFTYNIFISGFCKAGFLGSALAILSDMKKSEGGFGFCSPDLITYTTLLDGFLRRGLWEEAQAILRELREVGLRLNTVGYNCLISHLCRNGKTDEAAEMVRRMKVEGCKPDIETFNSLIHGLCCGGRTDEAFRLYDDLLLEGLVANTATFNTLIHCFLREGSFRDALRLADEMVFRGCSMDVITYNGLLKALCGSGDVDRALGMYEEMVGQGVSPNAASYNLVIDALCRRNRLNDAFGLAKEMVRRGCMPDIVTYNSLLNGLCMTGRLPEALKLLDTLELQSIATDIVTYNTLITWYCRAGMSDFGVSLLGRALEIGIVPNDVTWSILVGDSLRCK